MIGPNRGAATSDSGTPSFDLNDPDLAAVSARFAAMLHAAGVPVTPERAVRLAAALALAPPATVGELYWLARVTLLSDPVHFPVFDAVFGQVFAGLTDPAEFRGDRPVPSPALQRRRFPPTDESARPGVTPLTGGARSVAPGPGGAEGAAGPDGLVGVFSPDERLRRQDFSRLSEAELAHLRELTSRLNLALPPRRSRRWAHRRHHPGVDARATLRRARRTGGEPAVLVGRQRRMRPRKLVLICDISGSMEAYARVYLQLLVSAVGGSRAEAFVFATRLTRLTRAMRGTGPDSALERAGRAAPDWSGGTRIGECLKAFNDGYGRRGLARGAIVMILSDGWDTGDPDMLGREMSRLRRLAFRTVWVNPRKAAPGYAPLARGMAAALPSVDEFLSGHSWEGLEEVVRVLSEL